MLVARTCSCKLRSWLSSATVTLCFCLVFAARGPSLAAASVTLLPAAPPAMAFASQPEPQAPSTAPLATDSPSSPIEQRLDSLEGKVDELVARTGSSRTAGVVDIVHKIVVAAALGVSGIWGYWLFVQNRQRYPRASLAHRITHMPVSRGKVLLHVTETVRNEGNILLSLEFIQTRIQRVLPPPAGLLTSIAAGTPVLEPGETQYLWPLIDRHECRWDKEQCEIEPDESHDIHHDFIVDGDVQVVEVYTYVRNMVKRRREIGWNLKTVYRLSDAQEVPCQGERTEHEEFAG